MSTLDRDALTRLLLDGREPADAFALRDAILALVQPEPQERSGFNRADTNPGLTLTAEEARVAAWALRHVKGWPDGLGPEVTLELLDARPALADRLEQATS